MKPVVWTLLVVAAGLAACASDLALLPVLTDVNGVHYSVITATDSGRSDGVKRVTVYATLTNTTVLNRTRTYPVACPVRIRLYRKRDVVLVYDESKLPCDQSVRDSLTIEPQQSRGLQSPTRTRTELLGDSLPHAIYVVRALMMTEGSTVVEIAAGTSDLADPFNPLTGIRRPQ